VRVKKLQEEITEAVKEALADLRIERLKGDEAIDCGAEEELYRRVGQQAAGELLANRWQEADAVAEAKCGQCQRNMKAMGRRKKRVRTLCETVGLQRKVFYCSECGVTRVPLDERLGITQTGITPGLSRVVCRSALELPYKQSQQLLDDSLGFEPCSAREIERIANQHGEKIEQMRAQGKLIPALSQHPIRRIATVWQSMQG